MNRKGLTLLEILLVVIVIGVLAALLLPSQGGTHCGKLLSCGHNMAQLYKVAMVSPNQDALMREGWVFLTRLKPPIIDSEAREILACPLRGVGLGPDECDYRSPRIPISKLGPSDPVAADKPGNHGDGQTINVLLKDGRILEAEPGDPLWKRCEELLR